MQPYYQDDWATIYHGDCIEWLGSAPDDLRVDLVLTDPPYGLGDSTTAKNDYVTYEDTRENLQRLIDGFMPLVVRMADVVVLTPGNKHHRLYPAPSWTMAWFVPAGTGRGPWGFCCWQPILCYGSDPKLTHGQGSHPDALVMTETGQKNGHPCAKPLGVWKWPLDRCSHKECQTILDPFMGSGTTLRAAKDLNHHSIGIEIEEKYCEIAANRLQQEVFDFTGGADG